MRAMAEQAEAEAAAAEALAAAARARARALQLRRQAERADAAAQDEARANATVESEAKEPPPDSDPQDMGPVAGASPARGATSEGVATEEPRNDSIVERDADVSSSAAVSDATADKPRWYRRRPSRRRLSVVVASLGAILVLASLVGGTLMVVNHRHASLQRQRVAEFTAAARQGVVTLTSLDFHHAKQDVQRIIDNSTGAFRDDFHKAAPDFVTLLEQSKVIEQGIIRAAAVDLGSMTNDAAVVLVVSTSEITNATGTKQDPRIFRLLVTVDRDGDQLKMSKVEFVP
jgi:Mce-associated membrane protein